MMTLAYFLVVKRKWHEINNPFTWLIVYYLLFAFIQASIAGMKYEQSLIVGIIKTRDQLYYLSFPLFLCVLQSENGVRKFMNILSLMSFLVIALSVANYFGATLFYHRWAEGTELRSGIHRAFVPAMAVIATSFVWQFNKYLHGNKAWGYPLLLSIALYAAIIFRQTRMLIIAGTFMMLLMLFLRKRLIPIVSLMSLFAFLMVVQKLLVGESILFSAVRTTADNVANNTGTWIARVDQMRVDWQVFTDSPWFGSGLSAVRAVAYLKTDSALAAMAHTDDLGYTHWMKFYGISGIIWLVALIFVFYRTYLRTRTGCPQSKKDILQFAMYNFTFILIAYITQNYFMSYSRVLISCLTLALLVRCADSKRRMGARNRQGTPSLHLHAHT